LSGYGDDGLRVASQFIREAFLQISSTASQFKYSGGKFGIVLMPPTRRAWPKEIRLTKGGL